MMIAPRVEPAQAGRVPSPAQTAARQISSAGLLRRSDLGAGWALSLAAPARAPALACGARGTAAVVASGSPTWSRGAAVFASGTSYVFAGAGAEQRAWRVTGSAAMRRCVERQLELGSGGGVHLVARSVRSVPGPRLSGSPASVAVRRYVVTGTATGAGQDVAVSLSVVLIAVGRWIGEDDLSLARATAPAGVQARAAGRQVRRAAGAGA